MIRAEGSLRVSHPSNEATAGHTRTSRRRGQLARDKDVRATFACVETHDALNSRRGSAWQISRWSTGHSSLNRFAPAAAGTTCPRRLERLSSGPDALMAQVLESKSVEQLHKERIGRCKGSLQRRSEHDYRNRSFLYALFALLLHVASSYGSAVADEGKAILSCVRVVSALGLLARGDDTLLSCPTLFVLLGLCSDADARGLLCALPPFFCCCLMTCCGNASSLLFDEAKAT